MTKFASILSAAAAAFASQALATASHPNHTGFYLGVNGGYEIGKTKVKSSTNGEYIYNADTGNDQDTVSTASENSNRSLNSKGFAGGTHFGYQHQSNRVVVGGELSFSFFNSKRKRTSIIGTPITLENGTFNFGDEVKIRHKYNMGAALKFGYLVSPTVVAGIKLGYAQDKYDFRTRQYLTNAAGTTDISQKSKKFKVNSFVPGIYVEKLINNHWLIGGEYNYSISKAKKLNTSYAFNGDVGIVLDNGSTSTNKQFKPSAHAVKIRLGYKF